MDRSARWGHVLNAEDYAARMREYCTRPKPRRVIKASTRFLTREISRIANRGPTPEEVALFKAKLMERARVSAAKAKQET